MDEQKNQNPQPQPATDVAAKSSPPGAVVAGGAGEKPAAEAEKPATPEVKEHSIDAAEAKKFEGAGDFAMPVSPLSEAVKAEGQTSVNPAATAAAKPANQTGAGIEKPNAPQTVPKSMAPPPAKIEDIQTQTIDMAPVEKVEEKKPAEAAVKQTIISGSTKDLEKKAKDLLKDLDKSVPTSSAADGEKPKKKRRSGGVTKMALAAVLVVMMGAGGVVGVNLFKMNQSTETRSQAADSCSGLSELQCENKPAECDWIPKETASCTFNTCSISGCTCSGVCYGESLTCRNITNKAQCTGQCSWTPTVSGTYTLKNGYCEQKEDAPAICGDGNSYYCKTGTLSNCAGEGIKAIKTADNLCCVVKDNYMCGSGQCVSHCSSLGAGDNTGDYAYSCTSNSCSVKTPTGTQGECLIFYYRSSKRDTNPVYVPNCKVERNVGDVETVNCGESPSSSFGMSDCGAHQIDVGCLVNGTLRSVDSRSVRNPDCTSSPPSEPPPTDPPTTALSCTGLQSTAGTAPKIGNKVVFTCSGQGDGLSKYEFQYKIDDGAYVPLAASTTDKTKSVELTISQAGVYTAQCRVCKADNTCTAWGAAQ